MASQKTLTDYVEELEQVFDGLKKENKVVAEGFDVEIFTLGYLTALQNMANVHNFDQNLNDLILMRTLEYN